ncbi:MAG: hypothetical protein DID90_2727553485 [Candidatus Nitrotoga sp. LAW]|nr:MAG: hypothetical protein DID90_2727553485 [Candidatus Nitrotoga sp. LAW]
MRLEMAIADIYFKNWEVDNDKLPLVQSIWLKNL